MRLVKIERLAESQKRFEVQKIDIPFLFYSGQLCLTFTRTCKAHSILYTSYEYSISTRTCSTH